MKKIILTGALGAAALVFTGAAASAATLDDVKAKGFVQCGVSQGLPGFSNPDADGNWSGLDVDLCRAVAAAIFGDGEAVKFTPLSAKERFTALQSGEVDLLSRNTTWTMSRDTQLGLNFAGVNYYDGQGFMVKKSLGIGSALELVVGVVDGVPLFLVLAQSIFLFFGEGYALEVLLDLGGVGYFWLVGVGEESDTLLQFQEGLVILTVLGVV